MAENVESKNDPDLEAVLAGLEEMFSSIPAVEARSVDVPAEPKVPAVSIEPVSTEPARDVPRSEIKLTFPESPAVPEPAPKKEPASPPPAAAPPPPTPAPTPSPIRTAPPIEEPFLEMLPKSTLPPKPVEAAAPPASPSPAPAPVVPAPAVPISPAPGGRAAAQDQIPSNAPKEQIRRVAFFGAAGMEKNREGLADFLKKAALTLTKKPLHIRAALVKSLDSGFEVQTAADAAREAAVAAVIVLADGLSEDQLSRLEKAVSDAGIFFTAIPSSDVGKRSMAMDLVMDLMLLAPEA